MATIGDVLANDDPTSFAIALSDLVFQRYDLAGIYIGTQTVRAELLVDPKSGTYTAKGTFRLQDIAGVQVGTGCSRVVGKRYPQSD